jgi:hypothetical protein
MVRTALAGAFVVVALGASTAGQGATGVTSSQPALRIVDGTPLTLRGTGFAAGERVRVLVRVPGREQKRVTASWRGSFVAAFNKSAYNRCSGLTAFAIGSRGSRARLLLPAPACPPSP